MADVHTKAQRTYNMSRIRGKDTKPELQLRRMIHKAGYRYRLHCKDLPGKPDLVFPSRKKVIFVHGCFWHRHDCKYGRVKPKTNAAFWEKKIAANVKRDNASQNLLKARGWEVCTVWECELADSPQQLAAVLAFLLSTDCCVH